MSNRLHGKVAAWWRSARRWFQVIHSGWNSPTVRDLTPPFQKTIFADYASQAVQPESGHLDEICATAARNRIAVYLGCVERAADRGAHSLYCSLVFIDPEGQIASIHRKLMPTYEERLVWATSGNPKHAPERPSRISSIISAN
jgi:predicted amidohydrolase